MTGKLGFPVLQDRKEPRPERRSVPTSSTGPAGALLAAGWAGRAPPRVPSIGASQSISRMKATDPVGFGSKAPANSAASPPVGPGIEPTDSAEEA